MSGIINTGSFSKLLWPGLKAIYGQVYDQWDTQYDKVFDKNTSDRAYEEDLGISTFGLAVAKSEGAPINYDIEQQGFLTRYTHITYALGFVITREMMEDDQYDTVGKRRAKELAWSMRETKELIAANILNNAFNAGVTYGDGKSLIDTSRPNVAGGTWTNKIAVAADLSEAALEQAVIDIMRYTDDRGKRIAVRPQKLIIPPELWAEAARITQSEGRVGTDNNDVNALLKSGRLPEVFVMQRLTDPDAWFIKTNIPEGLKYYERVGDTFEEDNDFDTDNARFKARARYSFGMTDPRCIYGSAGA